VTAPAGPATLPEAARRAVAGVWWYLRELSGEVAPVTRREFERHRDRHREASTQGRCC
jgi:hypothetical protein